MRKGVKQCFDEILPGTLDDSKEPFSCVLFKSLLDTTDKATEEKVVSIYDSLCLCFHSNNEINWNQ